MSRKNNGMTTSRGVNKPRSSRCSRRATRTGSFREAESSAQNQLSQYSRTNPQYSLASRKRMGRGTKIVIAALCVVVLLFVGGGTAFGLYMNSINIALAGDKTEEERQAIADTLAPVRNYKEPFYMMLIGSDARADSDEMGHRSDTNILVRIDPVDCVVTMVSIPRDTMIELDGYGTNKFNAAYSYEGTAGTIREAGQLCDVDIAHYAEISFEELIALVDVVGGVEIKVPERIDDPNAGSVVIEAGKQTLDGESALTFARSRDYTDGDFTRTSNQRLLIEALVKKILSLPVTELPGVVQRAAECVTTDFTAQQIIDLALQFQDIGSLTMYSTMVPSGTDLINDVSYVIADTYQLAEVMKAVEAGKDPSLVGAEEEADVDTSKVSS